ncbi:MAG: FkbM family methyltransferase [Hyphomicrobiaceae bacterium]|nr:FkbM family methyltransferase [Hyphomicrobiaceae bacterium]
MPAPTLVFNLLRRLERFAANKLGKGYGAATLEQEVAAMASLLGTTPKLAIDIGGNVGGYSQVLRDRFPGLEIHVFEPARTNLARLADRFGADPLVRVNPNAVGSSAGSATLFSDEPGSGLGSLTKRDLDFRGISFEVAEAVEVIRFETYWRDVLASRPIDMIKLDIEGHELDALAGMGEALRHVGVVQFEFGGANIDTHTYLRDFFTLFATAGFELYRITPLGPQRLDRYRESEECFLTTNFIARRKP